MPTLRLLVRLGQHKAGDLIEYSKAEATYLVDAGKAERVHTTTLVLEPVADNAEQQPEAQQDTDEDQYQEQGAEQHDEQPAALPSLPDLKAQAVKLGLATYGSRAQLADRIQQHHDRQQPRDHTE